MYIFIYIWLIYTLFVSWQLRTMQLFLTYFFFLIKDAYVTFKIQSCWIWSELHMSCPSKITLTDMVWHGKYIYIYTHVYVYAHIYMHAIRYSLMYIYIGRVHHNRILMNITCLENYTIIRHVIATLLQVLLIFPLIPAQQFCGFSVSSFRNPRNQHKKYRNPLHEQHKI